MGELTVSALLGDVIKWGAAGGVIWAAVAVWLKQCKRIDSLQRDNIVLKAGLVAMCGCLIALADSTAAGDAVGKEAVKRARDKLQEFLIMNLNQKE